MTDMPICHLERLPCELLLLIIAYCKEDCSPSKGTLRCLCRTSRLCHRLTTPILFEEYYGLVDGLPGFARVLVTRPDIAKHVKSVRWDPHGLEIPDSEELVVALRSHQVDFANSAADFVTTTDYSEDVNSDDIIKYLDNCLLVFLMCTPNLESLCIMGTKESKSRVSTWLPPITHRLPHSFCRLKSVDVLGATFNDICVLLSLPSLRTLKASSCYPRRSDRPASDAAPDGSLPDGTLPPGNSKLEELVLAPSHWSKSEVVAIIEACEALQTFIYSRAYHQVNLKHHAEISTLKAALDKHAPSLRELEIRMASYYGEPNVLRLVDKLDTFAPYAKLVKLTLPAYALIPLDPGVFVNQLPPNLEILQMDDAFVLNVGWPGRTVIELLLRVPKSSLPKLQSVHLPAFQTTPIHEEWEDWRKCFREKSIALRSRGWDFGAISDLPSATEFQLLQRRRRLLEQM